MSNDRIKEPHVRVMAKYIESELAGMYKADAVSDGAAVWVHAGESGSCRIRLLFRGPTG